jgi:hypothetical protein
VFTVEASEDQRRGGAADRGGFLSHDGDPGLQQVGEREVVEADHGDTVVQAQLLERADRPDGHAQLGGDELSGLLRAAGTVAAIACGRRGANSPTAGELAACR